MDYLIPITIKNANVHYLKAKKSFKYRLCWKMACLTRRMHNYFAKKSLRILLVAETKDMNPL